MPVFVRLRALASTRRKAKSNVCVCVCGPVDRNHMHGHLRTRVSFTVCPCSTAKRSLAPLAAAALSTRFALKRKSFPLVFFLHKYFVVFLLSAHFPFLLPQHFPYSLLHPLPPHLNPPSPPQIAYIIILSSCHGLTVKYLYFIGSSVCVRVCASTVHVSCVYKKSSLQPILSGHLPLWGGGGECCAYC